MAKKKKYLLAASPKTSYVQFSESEKSHIQNYFSPVIEDFKKQYVEENPNKDFSYTVDIYSKWYQSFFYLCEKCKSEHPNRLKSEFETKFARLRCTGKDEFELSYFRHTGVWHAVKHGVSLEVCRDTIVAEPMFHPIG